MNCPSIETDLRDEKLASSWKEFVDLMTTNAVPLHNNTQILSFLCSLLFHVVKYSYVLLIYIQSNKIHKVF